MRRAIIVVTVLSAGLVSLGGATEPVAQGEVSYMSGGTGSDERAALEAKAGRFNLKLIHAAPNGDYVSDVKVRISDAKGAALIDTVTEGPLLYAQLPPGSYSIVCSFGGQEQKRSVTVGTTQSELKFIWPS